MWLSASGVLKVFLGVLAALGSGTSRTPSKRALGMTTFVEDNRLNFWLMSQSATVMVARTIKAGPAPGGWSDSLLASQRLDLQVERVLCSPRQERREPAPPSALPPLSAVPALSLDVPVVRGARTAADRPGLAAWIAAPGSRSIYFLTEDKVLD